MIADTQTIRERMKEIATGYVCHGCKKQKRADSGTFYIAKEGTYCMGCVKGQQARGEQ